MKKTLAFALAAFMLAASIPALGAEKLSAEEAIAAAKTILPIPSEMTGFTYETDETGYYLRWRTPEDDSGASASVSADGTITGFSLYGDEYNGGRTLADYTKAQAREKARAFLKTVVPQIEEKLICDEESSTVARVVFNRYENGARVENNMASVRLNTATGQVTNYNLSWDFENSYTLPDTVIAPDEAIKLLGEKALSIQYSAFYNNEDKTERAFPVYRKNGKYILAADGEAFEPNYSALYSGSAANMQKAVTEDSTVSADGGGGGYRLTGEEQREVDIMKTLISQEDALARLRELPEIGLPEDCAVNMRYLGYYDENKKTTDYTARLMAEWEGGYGNVTFDGKTGEILSVNIYWDREETEKLFDDETLEATADSFINKIKDMSAYKDKNVNSGKYSFGKTYEKYVGEIPFPADSKRISVDPQTNKITYFSESVFEGEIETPQAIVGGAEAAENNYTAELVFTAGENGNPAAAYTLKSAAGSFSAVRAEDGKAVNYTGGELNSKPEKPEESGHWAWAAYERLAENGIAVEGGYMLDDAVTMADFEKLMRNAVGYGDVPYWRYESVSEDNTEAEGTVSRAEAADIVVDLMGWGKLSKLDIFKTHFADEAEFGGSCGAAAILSAMGIMRGDGGYFRPARNMTYGESCVLAINIIESFKEAE